ncbi:MAG: hypothetical protein J6Y62_06850 [Clostridia bacterium]|nr:hypothetical protein [Clostridia bacterium]
MSALRKMEVSFKEAFGGNPPPEDFKNAFARLSDGLKELPLEDAFVDAGVKSGLLDFNLFFKGGKRLSVATDAYHDDPEDVMYAFSKEGRTLSMGMMPLDELMDEMKKELM